MLKNAATPAPFYLGAVADDGLSFLLLKSSE